MTHIKVMPDYCSSGLWDLETGEEIDPVEFCVPLDIIERLDRWIATYDEATFSGKEPWEGGAEVDTKKLEFVNSEGINIAQEIKSLNPDWTVEVWLETYKDGKLNAMVKLAVKEVFKYKVS